ncbi:MAG TPA: serine/threonine-protein kinase [Planctomycetaceae bacterium]|nr:serine/threonine-protein kinase [Planctomycetaceae bacterium]
MSEPQNPIDSASEPLPSTIVGAVGVALPREKVGSVIGPYKLLQQLGEGGFGIVYMAEQERPVRRIVALKIIKPGMDTAQVIARFESERQALALMDHPNIARVLDAGATDSGHPYFVMELVKGVPITEFCDKNHSAPGERLKLFIDVCHAIQHAHHKGVIHRDIKPSNVLVTLHDGVPVVKVIDFGVAKATVQKLTEKTLFTAFGQMLGTPAYMSPEQAEMSGLDIDTRSDVYSLGVLLYELLTGTTPIEAVKLRAAGYAEMQRLIREQDAPRPSTRFSKLGDTATVVAVNRGVDVKRLVQLLSGDLDWVVMKALEKDRNRRYDTPGSFADDVQRYLRDEAIVARPPSTAYKVRKFAQRNRGTVVTATLVAGALLAGIVISSWQALRARRAEAAAVAAADEAAAREAETKAALGFVEDKVFAAARPTGQEGGLGRDVTLEKAIESAVPYVTQSFPSQPLIEARLRLSLGKSFYFLGEAQKAVEQEDAARALYTRYLGPDDPLTLQAMHNLASSYAVLGRIDEALRLREETLALRRKKLGPDDPDTLASMNNLALSYGDAGRHADALKLREETLARFKSTRGFDHPDALMAMNNLANAYFALNRYDEALKLREEAFALYKSKLGPDHPDTLRAMGNLASSLAVAGRNDEAIKLREETLALRKARLGPDHPATLISMSALGDSYEALGRHADALKIRQENLALRKAKLGLDHPDTLSSMNNVADSYSALGRNADSLKVREQTFALRRAKLGADHPDTLMTMAVLAQGLVGANRSQEASPMIDECLRLAVGKNVDSTVLVSAYDARLRIYEKAKDAASCRQTAEAWEKLNRADPDSLYAAACFRSVTASAIRATDKSLGSNRSADEEADRAMAWLTKAAAAGYKDAANLKKDHDLDSLRAREDFKHLVRRVNEWEKAKS